MSKVRALNRNGEVTWCTAKTLGSGNCNHVLHQTSGMTDVEFQKKVDDYNEELLRQRENEIREARRKRRARRARYDDCVYSRHRDGEDKYGYHKPHYSISSGSWRL